MSLENYKNGADKSFENIKTLDDLLEQIKKPEDLLRFMANIRYGYIGRENKKSYSPGDKNFDADFSEEYYLQTPEQLLESRRGLCWDQAELERYWFLKQGYEPKLYFLMFKKDEPNNLPTHTFLVYQKEDKFYWFENSFADQRGIHEYFSLEDLIDDVKGKHFDYAKRSRGADNADFKDIVLHEYKTPKFGCGPDEFITEIVGERP